MRQKNIPADAGHFLRSEIDCTCAVKKNRDTFLKKNYCGGLLKLKRTV